MGETMSPRDGLPRPGFPLRNLVFGLGAICLLLPTGNLLASGLAAGPPAVQSPTGENTLSIPIEVPGGISGVQPAPSLEYSSRGGVGSAGQGWDLPLSLIQVDVSQGFDPAEPTWLLDGIKLLRDKQGRLIPELVDGRVVVELGPADVPPSAQFPPDGAAFRVLSPDGWALEYGTTLGSALVACPETTGVCTAVESRLSRVINPFGLAVEYLYSHLGDDLQAYPTVARYTLRKDAEGSWLPVGTGHEVRFTWELFPSVWTSYRYGERQERAHRLARVEAWAGTVGPQGELIEFTELEYTDARDGSATLRRLVRHGRETGPGLREVQELVAFDYSPDGRTWEAWAPFDLGDDSPTLDALGAGWCPDEVVGTVRETRLVADSPWVTPNSEVVLDWLDITGDGLVEQVWFDDFGDLNLCSNDSPPRPSGDPWSTPVLPGHTSDRPEAYGLPGVVDLARERNGAVVSGFVDLNGDGHPDRLEFGELDCPDEWLDDEQGGGGPPFCGKALRRYQKDGVVHWDGPQEVVFAGSLFEAMRGRGPVAVLNPGWAPPERGGHAKLDWLPSVSHVDAALYLMGAGLPVSSETAGLVDWTGDGLPEYVEMDWRFVEREDEPEGVKVEFRPGRWRVWRNVGEEFEAGHETWITDWYGDSGSYDNPYTGLMNGIHSLYSPDEQRFPAEHYTRHDTWTSFADLNGDGLVDHIDGLDKDELCNPDWSEESVEPSEREFSWLVRYGHGRGFRPPVCVPLGHLRQHPADRLPVGSVVSADCDVTGPLDLCPVPLLSDEGILLADLDGNGLPDLVVGQEVSFNEAGESFAPAEPAEMPSLNHAFAGASGFVSPDGIATAAVRWLDVDANGLLDWFDGSGFEVAAVAPSGGPHAVNAIGDPSSPHTLFEYDNRGSLLRRERLPWASDDLTGFEQSFEYGVDGRLRATERQETGKGGEFVQVENLLDGGRNRVRRIEDDGHGGVSVTYTPFRDLELRDGVAWKRVFGPMGLLGEVSAEVIQPTDEVRFFANDYKGQPDAVVTVTKSAMGPMVTSISKVRRDPYGVVIDGSEEAFELGAGGGQVEPTGESWLGWRLFDPEIGRFLQADTLASASAGVGQGLNRYRFAWNSPTNYADPSGHWEQPLLLPQTPVMHGGASISADGGAKWTRLPGGIAIVIGSRAESSGSFTASFDGWSSYFDGVRGWLGWDDEDKGEKKEGGGGSGGDSGAGDAAATTVSGLGLVNMGRQMRELDSDNVSPEEAVELYRASVDFQNTQVELPSSNAYDTTVGLVEDAGKELVANYSTAGMNTIRKVEKLDDVADAARKSGLADDLGRTLKEGADWLRRRWSRNPAPSRLVARVKAAMWRYPAVPDPRTGRAISFPTGNLTRVPKADRVSWTSDDRRAFISQWYDRGYSAPRGGWSEYDIHHIQPRELGGNNEFWNLVPVQRKTHQDAFNSFWQGFLDP